VMEMWAAHFPNRRSEHYVFPSEKYGAGTDDFKPCVYGTDVTKPINDWKEAWEGAKRRAGIVLLQEPGDGEPTRADKAEHPPLQCRFHDLRHTACTRLLEGGVPYHVVATIMGWSASTAIRMAKRYGHIGQKKLQKLPLGPPRIPQSRSPVKLGGSTKSMKKNGSSGRTRTYNPPVNSCRSHVTAICWELLRRQQRCALPPLFPRARLPPIVASFDLGSPKKSP
jgi:hypothetical protein